MASVSASRDFALVTPTDEPMLAGLTKTGSPSASITSSAVPAPTSCSVKDSQRLCAMPCWASTCLAIALSMASAEPRTPLPT